MNRILPKKKPRFVLVVGSGGIRPIAAIPLLDYLDKVGVVPDLLIGCSGGAYVTAFWNAGYKGGALRDLLEEFKRRVVHERMFSRINYRAVLAIARYPGGHVSPEDGMLDVQGLLDFYREIFGERRLEDLPCAHHMCTTDLSTGRLHMLRQGPLVESIYASGSLYPIMPPMYLHGKWLVDGGYHNGLPLLQAVQEEPDLIVALSFEDRLTGPAVRSSFGGFLDFFSHSVSQIMLEHARNQAPLAVHLHQHELLIVRYAFPEPVAIWDVDGLPGILQLGHAVLEQYKPELDRLLRDYL